MHERGLPEDRGARLLRLALLVEAQRRQRERVGLAPVRDRVLGRARRVGVGREPGGPPRLERPLRQRVRVREGRQDVGLELERGESVAGGDRRILQLREPRRLERGADVGPLLQLSHHRERDALVARISRVGRVALGLLGPHRRLEGPERRHDRHDAERDRRRNLDAATRGTLHHIRYRNAVTEATERVSGWARLPRWGRIGIIAGAVAVVGIAGVVGVRVASRWAPIPTGVTAVGDLRPGACLAEASPTVDVEVVPCSAEHAAEVFAVAKLDLDDDVYAQVSTALQQFADAVCGRYLEYRLFLDPGIARSDWSTAAIAVPDPDAFAAGDQDALCVVTPADGGTVTGGISRPAP